MKAVISGLPVTEVEFSEDGYGLKQSIWLLLDGWHMNFIADLGDVGRELLRDKSKKLKATLIVEEA